MTAVSRSTYNTVLTAQALQDAYNTLPVGSDLPTLVVYGHDYVMAEALCRSVYGENFRATFRIAVDTVSALGPEGWAFRVPL